MIEKAELERVGKIKGLNIRNIEKDYLLELLLFILYKESGRKLVFKGGTALYKLHNLNRFSEDLDFTLTSTIKIEDLFKKIITKLGQIGIKGRIKAIDHYRNQVNIKSELKGPLFDGNIKTLSLISINISLKEKPIYAPEQRMIFSQYPDIVSFDVFIMPLNELFAEKIRALLSRSKARDVYDIWFLLNKGVEIKINDINKKLKLYKKTFNKKEFLEKIEATKKIWDTDLRGLIIGELPDFDKIKEYVVERFE